MSTTRTRPSLLGRINANQHELATIPAGRSGIEKPMVESFSERYRGTEYEGYASSVHTPSVGAPEPLLSNGRLFMLGSATTVTVLLGVMLAAVPA